MDSRAESVLPVEASGALPWSARLGRDGLVLASFAVFAGALVLRLVGQINADGWLALVAGRWIAHHGLPHHETLTVWSHGGTWVDQQWLAQLGLYGLYVLGGLALVAAAHAALTGGAYLAAIAAARRLGGSPRAVLFVLPPCFWLLIFGSWQARTQSFAYLPFVAVLWLLVEDRHRPSGRVFLVLPLLAVWGNLHGSVVLGAALVVLRGLTRRSPLLVLLPPLALLVSPYGLDLVGYYRETPLNPAFGAMVNEWQAPTIGVTTLPFFALLAVVAWLAGRHRSVLNGFEQLALLATAASGLVAQRNIVWFALAALMLLPRLVSATLGPDAAERPGAARFNALLATVALSVLALLFVRTLVQPDSFFEHAYPAEAATIAARSDSRVLANVEYADWLLWREPSLAGRLAYDARLELLSRSQILRIYDFGLPFGGSWRSTSRGYDVLVLDRETDRYAIRGLLAEPETRVAYDGSGLVVVERSPSRNAR
jgi:hypothetical protein